jgi:hypothetical protein
MPASFHGIGTTASTGAYSMRQQQLNCTATSKLQQSTLLKNYTHDTAQHNVIKHHMTQITH